MKIFDWRYAIYNNCELAILFLILAISVYFTGLGQFSLTITLISALIYLFINRRWKEPFRQAHPDYDPGNRKAHHWGWRISMMLLFAALIAGVQYVLLISSRLYFPTVLIFIFLASFVQDGLTQPKVGLTQTSGSQGDNSKYDQNSSKNN